MLFFLKFKNSINNIIFFFLIFNSAFKVNIVLSKKEKIDYIYNGIYKYK
jgi:hypothetical protein